MTSSADPTGWQSDGSYVPCPECGAMPEPDRPNMVGVPVRLPGTLHHQSCSHVIHLSPEAEERLRRQLEENDRARRRAWEGAQNHVIG